MAYTTIDDPSVYFQAYAFTKSSGTGSATFDGNSDLQPDFLWVKSRTNADSHEVWDSTRGVSSTLFANNTEAQDAADNRLTSFDTDGFSWGNAGNLNAAGDFVSWAWKANGGTTSSNTDGDITSTVQADTTAGFSIVTYTGNGSTSDQTIGHGLGVRANAVILKNRDSAVNWVAYVDGCTANHCLELNTTDTESDSTQGRVLSNAGTRGTSTIFSIRSGGGSVVQTNTSGDDYVAYCFAEKQGYSKFGSYVGNGNADGPFVYTGFKPAFVLIKNIDATQVWIMYDGARKPFNRDDNVTSIYASESNAEYTGSAYHNLDILSNGFKIRLTDASQNGNGNNHVYMAFAENPFVTSTGIPTTAR